jgi:spermidine synthase
MSANHQTWRAIMIPWELIDTTKVPNGKDELRLYRRGTEFSIRIKAHELMNSRIHGSEEILAQMACKKIAQRPEARILIGGLGMGYTASEALKQLGPDHRIVVAEIVPAVVAWNRGPLADLAGRPLEDPRLEVRITDIAQLFKDETTAYDAILMDVDNGPSGLTREGNNWLYTSAGLKAAFRVLLPKGVLAVWSAVPDPAFTRRLSQAGFEAQAVRVRARSGGKGSHHTIWLAVRRG